MLETTDILISVHARFVQAMVARTKRVELRTRVLKVQPGCRIWLYSKSPVAMVTAVATLGSVETTSPSQIWRNYEDVLGLDADEFAAYTAGRTTVAALHLEAVRQIEPMSLMTMRAIRPEFQPPQFYLRLVASDPILSGLDALLLGETRRLLKRA